MASENKAKRILIDDMLIDASGWERFISEQAPAEEFVKRAEKYCNIKILDFKKNHQDPPDYFIWVDGQKIGLEVTRLSLQEMIKKNAFFKRLDRDIQEVCDKHKDILPKGNYFHFFTPTSNSQISFMSLKKTLEVEILKFFKNFSKENRKLIIKDKNREIGHLSLSKETDNPNGVNIFSFPQGLFPLEKFSKIRFENLIKLSLTTKERMSKVEPWWLLISDVDGLSSPSMINFNLSDTTIQSNIFERAFIIKIDYKDYPITELKVINRNNLN